MKRLKHKFNHVLPGRQTLPQKTPHTIPGYKVNVLFVYVSSQQIYDEVGRFLKFWFGMPVDFFFFLVFELK